MARDVVARLEAGKILDLGTGPGYLPVEIARISSAITIVGVDLSARLIRTAKKNALRAGLENRVHFETGNASSLDFPDAFYDMVISTGMLHMLRKPVNIPVDSTSSGTDTSSRPQSESTCSSSGTSGKAKSIC